MIVFARAARAFLEMKDCSQSHLSESPGVPLSHMLRVPVTFKWANTKDQRWTYIRPNGVLGIPS